MNRREMLAEALNLARRNGITEDEGFALDDEPARVGYAMSGHYTVDELAMILDDLKSVQSNYTHLCDMALQAEQQRAADKAASERGRAAAAAVFGDRKLSRVYVGANEGCRCGCRGSYHEAGSTGFKRAIARLEQLLGRDETKRDADVDSSYVNFPYGDGRAVTVYFAEAPEAST